MYGFLPKLLIGFRQLPNQEVLFGANINFKVSTKPSWFSTINIGNRPVVLLLPKSSKKIAPDGDLVVCALATYVKSVNKTNIPFLIKF